MMNSAVVPRCFAVATKLSPEIIFVALPPPNQPLTDPGLILQARAISAAVVRRTAMISVIRCAQSSIRQAYSDER